MALILIFRPSWIIYLYGGRLERYAEIVELLLDSGADPNIKNYRGNTALMMASVKGYSDIVRLLLERNADPNIQNNEGYTSLIWANRF